MRPEPVEEPALSLPKGDSSLSVGVEVVGLRHPLAKLIIDLINVGQLDHVNDPIGSSRQGTGNPMISHLVGEIETEQHGADPRPELRDLAITLEKDADIDRVLVNRSKAAQVLDDSAVDLADPRRMARQEIVDRDARHADMRLVG